MAPDKPTAEEVSTYASGANQGRAPDIRFIHYNDVYHITSSSAEPVGGIARFQTLINQYHDGPKYQDQPKLLNFFSGDAFNPSTESSITKGKHYTFHCLRKVTSSNCIQAVIWFHSSTTWELMLPALG